MTLFTSYNPNFYSLQDIMATQETVPCHIDLPISNLGFLIPGNDKEDIDQGTEMELPFWLASALSKSEMPRQRAIVTIKMPNAYNDRNREIFDADAKVVNLHRINPHFYEFGWHLCSLRHEEADLVKSLLVKAFKDRFRLLMDWTDNVMTEPQKQQMLDASERHLLRLGHISRMLLDAWLVDGVSNMQAAQLVVNLRKRKQMDES